MEAEFALAYVRSRMCGSSARLLIVDNHLHMRRTLATFRSLMKKGEKIELYWKSFGEGSDYGPGYSQSRFRHPLLFLGYEVLGLLYSISRGWA
jgi:uncharacterized SAM-binding protein YcdF (DUF218 family)